MTDQMDTLRDDLAFLRAVAADGARSGPRGGVILATAGFVFGTASLVAWAILDGRTGWPPSAVWAPWLVATAIFYAVLIVAFRAMKRQGGGGALGRLAGVAWAALGGASFSIILGYAVVATQVQDAKLWATTPTVFTALYGAGWVVASAASGARWMKAVAFASFSAAVMLAFCATSNLIWLGYAAALILLTGVPGLVLMRRPTTDA